MACSCCAAEWEDCGGKEWQLARTHQMKIETEAGDWMQLSKDSLTFRSAKSKKNPYVSEARDILLSKGEIHINGCKFRTYAEAAPKEAPYGFVDVVWCDEKGKVTVVFEIESPPSTTSKEYLASIVYMIALGAKLGIFIVVPDHQVLIEKRKRKQRKPPPIKAIKNKILLYDELVAPKLETKPTIEILEYNPERPILMDKIKSVLRQHKIC